MTTERRRTMSPGARWAIAAGAALVWAVVRATDGEVVNGGGWSAFAEFWTTIVRPETSAEFLRLTVDAAATTLALAILGTALAVVIGVVAAPLLAERTSPRSIRRLVRVMLTVPRGVHEVIWAILLAEVLGFDPWVGIIAIGLPFGAISAKVFAETIDETDPAAYERLRSLGAGRLTALVYGIVPTVRGELTSFGFYRLECAIRSAAVLGVIGVGGLGFQLDLSFESLRYDEIWTLIAALMLLSGGADWLSGRLRRRARDGRSTVERERRVLTSGLAATAFAIGASWLWLAPDAGLIGSERTRERFVGLVDDLVPPRLGPGGWSELIGATVDTIAMAIIALAIAVSVGRLVALRAARPVGRTADSVGLRSRVTGWTLRLLLLLWRAVPAPIWAFLLVLVLFPGVWPGAVALGIYNAGVVGRLFAEVIEERDPGPSDRLQALGAPAIIRTLYATIPTAAGRLVSIALYRSEVIVRETVVVGVVGAGGLGQLINEHRAARDLAATAGAVLAMIALAALIDVVSARIRRDLRPDRTVTVHRSTRRRRALAVS
ncbi:MAG: ABC transporter permease subunit [Actinomycetota bacterium]